MAKKKQKRRPNDRPMSPAALKAWRSEMGLAERDAALRLGISRGGLRNAELYGATLTIALACAARMAGIKPYGIKEEG